jgi:hypothetical protein
MHIVKSDNKITRTNSSTTTPRLQVVAVKPKTVTSTTVGLNQHVKKSVHRLVFQSELDIRSLRQVARLVGITGPRSEAKVLDVIRETVREATRQTPPPSGPAAAAWPTYRRAA